MAAAKFDIVLEQGETWVKTIRVLTNKNFPKNLVGYYGRAQIRAKAGDATIIASFAVRFVEPRKSGKVVLSLTSSQTMAFTFCNAAWDFFVTSPGGIDSKLLKGTVTVGSTVTKV